jgi:hypothetical protein
MTCRLTSIEKRLVPTMANVLKMMRQRREEEIRDFSAEVRALIRLF